MKFLNFAKVKKAWQVVKNFFAPRDKKKLAETALKDIKKETIDRRTRRGLYGYKNYTHKLIPMSGKNASVRYRSFNKQKLPGAKIIIGKTLFKIVLNPAYGR